MSTHKHIDRICLVISVFAVLLSVLFINGEALGVQVNARTMGYESRLFDTERVHTIDIVMDDWEGFISTCENEEYSACGLVIDGEVYKNVGIRAKGNTSLSSVSQMDSDRYSFKIEFDQYDNALNYYGLDKLCLNNLIQDNTMMKDYLVYQVMGEMGVAAPLCSYVYLTVNGEDWGLYLAVEAVEDSFLQRNYGNDYGELYKPDSMSFGAGRGNGKDFNMDDFDFENMDFSQFRSDEEVQLPEGFDPSAMFGAGTAPQGFDPSAMTEAGTQMPENFDPTNEQRGTRGDRGQMGRLDDLQGADAMQPVREGFNGGGMDFGMGSSDVKLQYIDDDPSSYANIFDNAKTGTSESDKARLINALKTLSEGENAANAVDVEAVIRYFVVHNFVVNGDSYTGSMIHNYYLYEEDGRLSMIPWDYNLAFGTFQGSSASDAVNDPIDTPLSVSGSGDRPMIDWIFSNEEYTQMYHQVFSEFLERVDLVQLIDTTRELIAPYVEKDPSKFCTAEEFDAGVNALREFCLLRVESISGQLDGSIPSTEEGQVENSGTLIDADGLTLSDMGSMGAGGGGNRGGNGFDRDSIGERFPGGNQRPGDRADSGNA